MAWASGGDWQAVRKPMAGAGSSFVRRLIAPCARAGLRAPARSSCGAGAGVSAGPRLNQGRRRRRKDWYESCLAADKCCEGG